MQHKTQNTAECFLTFLLDSYGSQKLILYLPLRVTLTLGPFREIYWFNYSKHNNIPYWNIWKYIYSWAWKSDSFFLSTNLSFGGFFPPSSGRRYLSRKSSLFPWQQRTNCFGFLCSMSVQHTVSIEIAAVPEVQAFCIIYTQRLS